MPLKNLRTILSILSIIILAIVVIGATNHAQAETSLSLTWSTSSFVPPNYQGKALATQNSRVYVSALVSQDVKNLKFHWKLDDAWQNFSSGLGRQTFNFSASQWPGYSHRIYLEASVPGVENDEIIATASIEIPVVSPEIHIYQTDPTKTWPDLFGETGITARLLAGSSTRFFALPFYFNIKKPTDLLYRWYLSGQDTDLSDATKPQVFDLDITPQTVNGVKHEIMLKCNNEVNPLERVILKFNVVVE